MVHRHHFHVEQNKIMAVVANFTKSHFISMNKISLDPNKLQVLIGVFFIIMFVVRFVTENENVSSVFAFISLTPRNNCPLFSIVFDEEKRTRARSSI